MATELDVFCQDAAPDDSSLRETCAILAECCRKISNSFRETLVSAAGTLNAFGEEQLSVDLAADKLIWDTLDNHPKTFCAGASEESPTLKVFPNATGNFVLCWDPLDGSSIVDCNFAVGTIIGIWKVGQNGLQWKKDQTLIGASGRQQVASLIAVYGPRLVIVLAINGRVAEFTLVKHNLLMTRRHEDCIIRPRTNMFSPANLRVASECATYRSLIDLWVEERKTLRYCGGFVPDIYQMFVKNQGVFCNPTSEKSKAKLRLAFECAPVAFLIEAAGGKAIVPETSGTPILDVEISFMDKRTSFCGGSSEEVDRCLSILCVTGTGLTNNDSRWNA